MKKLINIRTFIGALMPMCIDSVYTLVFILPKKLGKQSNQHLLINIRGPYADFTSHHLSLMSIS